MKRTVPRSYGSVAFITVTVLALLGFGLAAMSDGNDRASAQVRAPVTRSTSTDWKFLERQASRDLAAARGQLSFRVKVPRDLPKGLRLVRVSWSTPSAVDLSWYAPQDKTSLHVWETVYTGDELGAKDPTAGGSTVTIGRDEWVREVGGLCTEKHPCFGRRFTDGILVDLNGMKSESSLKRVAASLR